MKLSRIIDDRFYDSVEKLSKTQLPAKAAFKLKDIINALKHEYTEYDRNRNQLVIKYSLKNADGTIKMDGDMPAFDENGLNGFVEEINELTNKNIDMPTLKLSELGDNVVLSVEEANLLEDLIKLD